MNTRALLVAGGALALLLYLGRKTSAAVKPCLFADSVRDPVTGVCMRKGAVTSDFDETDASDAPSAYPTSGPITSPSDPRIDEGDERPVVFRELFELFDDL